jgi:glycosyltransferase involved in cell wall biosynthesis
MKSGKNIAIVLPFFTLGGAETQAFNMAVGLKKKGHNIKFFAFENKNELLKYFLNKEELSFELIKYDLNWIHLSGFKKFYGLRKVISTLRAFSPEYIFPFTYYPNIVVSSIWRLTGAKACYWNQRGIEKNPINVIEKIAIKMNPFYLSNSQHGANYIETRHGLKANYTTVINNGLVVSPPLKTANEWRKELDIKEDDICYVMVANLYPEKNHEYLLEGWRKFCDLHPNLPTKLILVGYSSQEIDLLRIKSKAYDLSLNNIIMLKSTNDISGLLQICSVGILTSESEGCPNAVLEYMYWEKPAVVSNIPATKKILGSDYPLFCSLDKIDSLVDALEKTLNNSFTKGIALNNKAKIDADYTIENLTKNYLKLLG